MGILAREKAGLMFKGAVMFIALALLASGLAAGCAPEPRGPVSAAAALEPVPEAEWPLMLDDLDMQSFVQACDNSLAYLRRLPPDRQFTFGPYRVTAGRMIAGLQKAKELFTTIADPVARTEAFKRAFILLRSVGSDGRGTVLMTGYYEPVMAARRQPQGPYVNPLYGLPEDLVHIDLKAFGIDGSKQRLVGRLKGKWVVPYPDRDQIDHQQAIKGKAEVLAYLADPVESFFLHIQGSGQVVFADGSRLRLGYAASNGHPYRSIGALLIAEGLLPRHQVSMQSIQAFLAAHPQERRRILGHNPSYVFFRTLSAEGGPLGCYNQPVTGGRSIATDRRIFPGAALVFINGYLPGSGNQPEPFSRFAFNQDTGGAIRGPGRLDLYFGTGRQAGGLAGRMKHRGVMYFLAPR